MAGRLIPAGGGPGGSAELTPEDEALLDRAAEILVANGRISVQVLGFTDQTGSDLENDDLSWERANVVSAYLQGRGVQESRVAPSGQGSTHPVAEGNASEDHAANRRVSLFVRDG